MCKVGNLFAVICEQLSAVLPAGHHFHALRNNIHYSNTQATD